MLVVLLHRYRKQQKAGSADLSSPRIIKAGVPKAEETFVNLAFDQTPAVEVLSRDEAEEKLNQAVEGLYVSFYAFSFSFCNCIFFCELPNTSALCA